MTEVRAQRMRAQGTAFPLAGVGLGENTRKTFWRKWYWNRNQDYEPTKINQMGAKWGRRGKAISERGTSRNKATEVITGRAELRSTLGLVLAEYSASEMSIEDEAGKVAKSWATKWGLHSVFKASIEAKQWQGQACILERGWGSRVKPVQENSAASERHKILSWTKGTERNEEWAGGWFRGNQSLVALGEKYREWGARNEFTSQPRVLAPDFEPVGK